MPSNKNLYERIRLGEVKVCFSGPKSSPPEYRFWACVDKNGGISRPDIGQCWKWVGHVDKSGYGNITIGNKPVLVHRFSWITHNGSIPDRLCVLHKCDIPLCVNPSHLFLGTVMDNNKDRDAKGRQAKGDSHGRSKLTSQDVVDIRREHVFGCREHGSAALAKKYGVSSTAIRYVISKRNWRESRI